MPEFNASGGLSEGVAAIQDAMGLVGGVVGSPDEGAQFRFEGGPYTAGQFQVVSFRGREELSKTFRFDIELAASGVEVHTLEPALLGQSACLVIHVPGAESRVVHGIVNSLRFDGVFPGSELLRVHVRLVPRLWLTTRNRTSRIFQEMSVQEIVTAVLRATRVTNEWRLANRYPKRVYCVQYQESDWEFITRLCAEEGIFFFFEQPGALLSELTGGASSLIGGAAGALSSMAGGVVGEVAGAVAGVLSPGEKVIFADRAQFYPAIADGGEGVDVAGMALERSGAMAQINSVAGQVGLHLAVSPVLKLRDGEGMLPHEDYVSAFGLRRTIKPKATLLKDYDFKRPRLDLRADARTTQAAGGVSVNVSAAINMATGAVTGSAGIADDVTLPLAFPTEHFRKYDHHGEDEDPDVSPLEAHVQLEQYRAEAVLGDGASFCRRLTVGHRFTLRDHGVDRVNREYVVTRVAHEGSRPKTFAGASNAEGGGEERDRDGKQAYSNRFVAAPSSVPVRPPRPRPKLQQVQESAVVVGPAGEEIYTDVHGRIKVQFHWDLVGRKNEFSSCWIRVTQAWAGSGWGFQFIPRVGMEVLVTFLGGDEDRPVVTGCLYNGENTPTFAVPDDRTKSGIRTQTYKRPGGYNEVSFDDQTDAEMVFIRAQKNRNDVVRHDQRTDIGHDFRLDVRHDASIEVHGNFGQVTRGNHSEHTQENFEESVGGSRQTMVSSNESLSVGGHVATVVRENYNLRVVGYSNTNVGRRTAVTSMNTWVWGGYNLGVSDEIHLRADMGVKITVGESTIEILPDQVKIVTPNLLLVGKEKTEIFGKGPCLTLDEKAELVAKEVTVVSKGAKLIMDDAMAKLLAPSTLIGSGSGADPKELEAVEVETKPFKVTVQDDQFVPLANRPYELMIDGVKVEGTTSGDGTIERDIAKAARQADLLVWVGDRPTGATRQWQIELVDEVAPISSVRGVQIRLINLGYLHGVANGTIDEATRSAVLAFQVDHDLAQTGDPADIAGRLEEVHTS